MLQINTLRQDAAHVKERLAVKHFPDLSLVDKIIGLDDERKKLQLSFEQLQSKVNSSSKEIGQLIAKGQKEDAASARQLVAGYKSQINELNISLQKRKSNCRKNW